MRLLVTMAAICAAVQGLLAEQQGHDQEVFRTPSSEVLLVDSASAIPDGYYLAQLWIVRTDNASYIPFGSLREISGQPSDINKDYGLPYTYVIAGYTMDRLPAAKGVGFQKYTLPQTYCPNLRDHLGCTGDLAEGTGGAYRYLFWDSYDSSNPAPITDIALKRSKTDFGVPTGFDRMTTDLNEDRGGDYLKVVFSLER